MKLSSSSHQVTCENKILHSLPSEDYERIRPHLEEVCLSGGRNLYECGDVIDYVYFPLDAMIYLFLTMKSGATVETGIIGSEGVLGFPVFMGVKILSSQARVFGATRALRIRMEIIKHEFNKNGWFQQSILQYIHAFGVQLSQLVACNRIHDVESRLCRWLLISHDRSATDRLSVTQELIAQMLGIHRPSLTYVVGRLQKKSIIKLRRGSIEIIDRLGLEESSCECYGIIRQAFDFLDSKFPSLAGRQKSSFATGNKQLQI